MAFQLDINAATPIIKQKYTQSRFNLLCFPDNPLYALMEKNTDFGGLNKVIAMRIAVPGGRGPTIGTAQASKTASNYQRFVLVRATDYATATITGETVKASRGDMNTLIEGLTKEIDGAIHNCMRSLAINMYRNGGGARGQISTTTSFTYPGVGGATISVGVAQNIILLANPGDHAQFEVGQLVTLSADDGTGTNGVRNSGLTYLTVTNIDRDNGLLTFNTTVNVGIIGATAGDYIFSGAPGQQSDYGSMVKGLAAWIPAQPPASTDNFFGVNRSPDTRLFGLRSVGGGAPMEETITDMLTKLCLHGAKPSHIMMNPLDWGQLSKALATRAMYPREKVQSNEMPDIGFEAFEVFGPKGPVKVIADLNCPKGQGYALQMDTWHLESLGPAPQILDDDGLIILRNPTADSYDVRIGYYANVSNEAPVWNGVMFW
jgi:hypothetical protein